MRGRRVYRVQYTECQLSFTLETKKTGFFLGDSFHAVHQGIRNCHNRNNINVQTRVNMIEYLGDVEDDFPSPTKSPDDFKVVYFGG